MTRSSDLAIRTRGLHKVFGGKVAVRNLTLDVPRGEIAGVATAVHTTAYLTVTGLISVGGL